MTWKEVLQIHANKNEWRVTPKFGMDTQALELIINENAYAIESCENKMFNMYISKKPSGPWNRNWQIISRAVTLKQVISDLVILKTTA